MAQVKERGGSFLPLPLPSLSFFSSRLISRSVKAKNPPPRSFVLRNQMETLATQATLPILLKHEDN